MSIVKELLSNVAALHTGHIFPAGTDLAKEAASHGQFYLIEEGALQLKLGGKLYGYVSEGNLVGLPPDRWDGQEEIAGEFGVKVSIFDRAEFLKLAAADAKVASLYFNYLAEELRVQSQTIADLLKSEVSLEPVLSFFAPGEVIIEQGSVGKDVYTLVEGQAEVFVDGVKVGVVMREEIFGMISAIGSVVRSASVVAESRCAVATVPAEKFIDLIRNKPQAVFKTIQDMSRLIIDLNRQIVKEKGKILAKTT